MVRQYIDYLASIRRYSPRTCSIYQAVLEDFYAYTAELDDERRFSVATLRNYEVNLLDERDLGARTVNLHLSVLSGYCRFLMRQGLLQSNPVHLVHRPREEKRLPDFYRKDPMDAYFASKRGALEFGSYEAALRYMVIALLAGTGVRRAELIGADRSDLDLARRTLRVHGKGDKIREIPLPEELCDDLDQYLQRANAAFPDADDSSPLLLTPRGGRLYPVFVDRTVKRELGEVSGINGRLSPHVLRHTLATELLDDGADLNSIKELLGHASLAATQVYTHNTVERLKSVYNAAHPRAKKTDD